MLYHFLCVLCFKNLLVNKRSFLNLLPLLPLRTLSTRRLLVHFWLPRRLRLLLLLLRHHCPLVVDNVPFNEKVRLLLHIYHELYLLLLGLHFFPHAHHFGLHLL